MFDVIRLRGAEQALDAGVKPKADQRSSVWKHNLKMDDRLQVAETAH